MALFRSALRSLAFLCLGSELFLPSIALGESRKLGTIIKNSSPDGLGLQHAYEFTNALALAQAKVSRTPSAENAFQLLETTVARLEF